ncbi:MAG: flagellar motor protein MotD [Telluria sp.]
MARKKYDEPDEQHDRWLVSYADFVTLLFAFFVVMYAISVVNEGKYRVLSDALGSAFGGRDAAAVKNEPTQVQPLPLPLASIVARRHMEAMRREKERLNLLAQQLSRTLAPLVKSGKVRVTQNGRGVSVEINASVLFDSGDARLNGDSVEALRAVAGLLKDDTHAIQVEGHTDNVPIANPLFPSNWELSATRASSVVRLFIDSGVAPERLTALGHGATQPVASNDDAGGRARNRRVAVTIISAVPDAPEAPAK